MINCVKSTSSYLGLKLNPNSSHAFLFYSADSELNNAIALSFAKSILCEQGSACGKCHACVQFDNSSHPDLMVINQPSVKVEDANKIVASLATTPIQANKKVFVILNAETVNESAQNKLLKSLEEPNESTIFILTVANTDKILPTVMSRLNKQFVPALTNADKVMIANELAQSGINISALLNKNLNLTEMLNIETNDNFKQCLDLIDNLFNQLKTSADIPKLSSQVQPTDKKLFLYLLEEEFLSALNKNGKYDTTATKIIQLTFSEKAMIKSVALIEEAYKKLNANVNFGYILDNLLFNILKEKFLCK